MEITHDRLVQLIRGKEYRAGICNKDEYEQYIYPNNSTPPSNRETIASDLELLTLKIQDQTKYLYLTHILPNEVEEDLHYQKQMNTWLQDTAKLPKTLYGEIWDVDPQESSSVQRYLSHKSAQLISKQLLLPSFY
jgi:hypothetical protein